MSILVLAGKTRQYGMASGHSTVFLSQKPNTTTDYNSDCNRIFSVDRWILWYSNDGVERLCS